MPATHPLEGRIWDARAARFITADELLGRLRGTRYRLLGEVHDHPEHHRLRASLIAGMGGPGEIFFEQFDRQHDAMLREAQRAGGDADALARAGRLDEKNWRWPLHRPLLAAALAGRQPVRAANLSRGEARAIVQAGALGTGNRALAEVLARSDWTPRREAALRKEILDSHCGALPERLAPGMALAQRARDAAMATALVSAPGPAVLIAGNGHVRRDRGVPLYLARGASVASVGFLESAPDQTDPARYVRGPEGELRYDFAWFTAPIARPDPCEGLRGLAPVNRSRNPPASAIIGQSGSRKLAGRESP